MRDYNSLRNSFCSFLTQELRKLKIFTPFGTNSYTIISSSNDLMSEKKGQELAAVSVYLNTGIVAALFGVGFIAAALIFGVVTLIVR